MSKEKQSTRDTILHTIKSLHAATVDDLAEAADVSPVTVRHHLNALQADQLITAKSVRRKVGRPHYVYSLSDDGQELFPKKYFSLSNRLLEEMKSRFPEEVVASIFSGVAQSIIDEHRGEFEHLEFEQKLNYLVKLLSAEGFMAQWEETADGYRITEYSCPYFSMGEEHREVCTVDTNLILTILETTVEQHSCMLEGDHCCQFTVPAPSHS